MQEKKKIYCPNCKRRVAEWDGRSRINIIVNCKKCWKRVVYHVDSQTTEAKNIPKRNTSSGKRFY